MTLPTSIAARAVLAPDRDAWLGLRGIGGSAIAAIRGTPGAFGTRWKVYAAHQPGGGVIDRDDAVKAAGRKWEPAILELYASETGRRVEHTPNLVVRHARKAWATASPDGFVNDADLGAGGFEAKTDNEGSTGWGPSGEITGASDASTLIPAPYADQVSWYLEVTGLPFWDVGALLAGWGIGEFRWYRILRDADYQRALLEEVDAFKRRHLPAYVLEDGRLGMAAGALYHLDGGYDAEGKPTRALQHPGGWVEVGNAPGLLIGQSLPLDGSADCKAVLDRRPAPAKGSRKPLADANEHQQLLLARIAHHRAQKEAHAAAEELSRRELLASIPADERGVRMAGWTATRVVSNSAPRVNTDLVRERCPEALTPGSTHTKLMIKETR